MRNVLKVSELNNRVIDRANMKCGELGRSIVWRRTGKSSKI